MIWVAVVLGVFLFYQFVERKHKMLVFKISLGLLGVLAIFVAGYWAFQNWDDKQTKSQISVELSYKNLELPKEKQALLVSNVAKKFLPTVRSAYFSEVTPEDYESIKNHVYFAYLDVKLPVEYEWWDRSDGSIRIYFDWLSEKTPELEAKVRANEKERVNRAKSELEKRRQLAQTAPIRRLLYYSYLHHFIESLEFEEDKAELKKSLLPWESHGVESFKELKEQAYEALYKAINSDKALTTKFSFNICNKKSIPLLSYSFYVSGFERGRSTENSIDKSDSYGSGTSTRFSGDIIIPASKCSSIEWTGAYKFYDKFEITGAYGTWKDTK